MKSEINFSIVYGIHPIIEVIRAKKRKLYEVFIDKNSKKSLQSILDSLESYTKINYCDKKKLDYLAQTTDHQSIVCYVGLFPYQKNLFKQSTNKNIILVANKIQDTRNLGALLRSAYCTNITKIIIEEKLSTDITGSVLKSSAGLAEHLDIYKTKQLEHELKKLREYGYSIYLADANGSYIDTLEIQNQAVIIIGNEHEGITKSLYKYGQVVSLRQKESQISYNASVAGGIIMYTISKSLELI